MVKALLAMTTGEFANSEALSKVRDLLNDVAGNLTKSIAKFNEDEEFAQTSFEVDVKNKEAEINRM